MENSVEHLQASANSSLAAGCFFKRSAATRPAILHAHGRQQCVDIHDFSSADMKLDRAFGLKPGDPVTVELLSRRTIRGTVAWSVAAFCGIEFDQPLAENDSALTGG
jgi:hypothetical protein